ncbi:5-oxoprolinase subunit PxpB [Winogradskyella flava]|uniref:5-oxoprolinase subunit PxpB n=1 Tax=Winogradskyella flava TaxID=1884876 RepID=UPI0024906013|nr:5-oxoprolinase subunit PxpB [Winogradskyella flava]
MEYNLKFLRYNERSILIEWPAIIGEIILKSILNYKKRIQNKYIKQKVDIINTYSSILIIYDFTIDNLNDEIFALKLLYEGEKSFYEIKSKTWEIPVCYDTEFGFDLEQFSKHKELSESEVIELHTKPIYKVYFIGFLPGFLYLGGLDSKLFLDRKSTPNLNVKKGSVAIGGKQTGIYPQDSPGGWHVIGKTPIKLFDINQNPPCLIQSGDSVKFVSVDKSEYHDIEERIAKSSFQLNPVL